MPDLPIALLCLLLAAGGAGLIRLYLRVERQQRAERLEGQRLYQERFERAARDLSARGFHPIRVDSVYQRAARGAKAVVSWRDTGRQQDAWFEGWHPTEGAVLLVRGRSGYGAHNRNPNVLFISPGDIAHY